MGASHSSALAQKVDPALFGALPAISNVEISPDGSTVALLQRSNGQSTVVFVDLNDPSATPKGAVVGDVKARRMEWVDDNYLILLASDSQNLGGAFRSSGETMELFRWISIAKDTREMKILLKKDASYYVTDSGNLLATTPNSPNDAVFARWTSSAGIAKPTIGLGSKFNKDEDVGGYSLFNVDVRTGKEKITYRGNPETWDWIVDDEGEAILRIDFNQDTDERKIYRRRDGSKTFDLLSTYKAAYGSSETISFFGVGSSADEILVQTYGDGGKIGLFGYNLNTGQIDRTVFHNEKFDVTGVAYDLNKATVTAVYYTDDAPRVLHLDPDDQRLQENLGKSLAGTLPYIASKSRDGNRMIIRAAYADRPTDVYLFDKTTKNLSYFSSTRPAIADKIYANKVRYNYVSPDGLAIDGYLTTPAGAEKNNLPLIVLPHGGPESRDTLTFDWWAFFYAARGYAVYQPNFRGSYGYGLQFREAGYGEWGRKMQDDITNGVQKLIGDGIADPSRVCIVGGSYGGYAALAGATLTPDLYACAVSVNGVSDLPSMIGEAGSLGIEYWETRIGSRFRNADELNAVSPAKRAANAGAPIMLIHGKDDTVVPFYQSDIMRRALESANKPHEFVELAGEDHWLSKESTRTEMLLRSIEFIDKHIGDE